MAVLDVDDLKVVIPSPAGDLVLVDGVGFGVDAGRTLAVVGESGCGKTLTCLTVMGLLPRVCRVAAGRVRLDGADVLGDEPEKRHRRRQGLAMVFQNPSQAMNPVRTIGWQVAEAFVLRQGLGRGQARRAAIDLLERVGIPEPKRRAASYPHQLSGGMNQRAMIAMAIAGNPRVLVADEATTALDVTIQAQILELLRSLQRETGLAIVFVTHDLGVVAEMADDVVVMYAGRIAERAPVTDLFVRPRHPYTEGLLASVPRPDRPGEALVAIPGTVPPLAALPQGCAFQPRCVRASARCRSERPLLARVDGAAHAACLHPSAGDRAA